MKKYPILLCLFLALYGQVSAAKPASAPFNVVSVNVNCNYSSTNKFGKTTQNSIQNVLNLKQNEWTMIGGSQSRAQSKAEGVFVLFGKIEQAEGKVVKIKFLTVSLNDKTQLARESSIIMPYAEHEKIKFSQGENEIQIDVVAIKRA